MEHIKIAKVEGVYLHDRLHSLNPTASFPFIPGTLYITSSHLIFVEPDGRKEIWISHMHISSLEKSSFSSSASNTVSGTCLKIKAKNFMNYTFIIAREKDCSDVIQSLNLLSKPAAIEDLYAFTYSASDWLKNQGGCGLFDIQSEYLRMGLPNDNWMISHINKNFQICETYPSLLYVPSTSSSPMLTSSSKFRSKGRLPVLSYFHPYNQACICRCSQPLAGLNSRCPEDEALFQSIRKSNPASPCPPLYLVDTRPKINALANRAAGKGYESESSYSNVKFKFFNIENIHVMRGSLNKLVEACDPGLSMTQYLSSLQNSGWLKHIRLIVETSVFVAKAVSSGCSVVIHCSDGWDRTAQVVSLASLLLDPYYRTIEGFQILIEKEWISFGHKFTDRCGFISSCDPKESAPIFTQFLDCVWQIMNQFKSLFEFDEKYLIFIHDHLYSCQFGNFLANSYKERIDLKINEKTHSLWSYLSNYKKDFLNPFFTKNCQFLQPVLLPVINPQSFKFWRSLYCRYVNGIHPQENLYDITRSLVNHTQSLSNHKMLIQKRINYLHDLLGYQDNERNLKKILSRISASESMDFTSFLFSPSSSNSHSIFNNSSNNISCTESSSSGCSSNNHKNQDEISPAPKIVDDFDLIKAVNNCTLLSKDKKSPLKNATALNSLKTPPSTAASTNNNLSAETNDKKDEENNFENEENSKIKKIDKIVSSDQLLRELKSVAIDIKDFRDAQICSCLAPFEQHSMKNHCWACGEIFCTRCIEKYTELPGHLIEGKVAICKDCFREICSSPQISVHEFQKLIENA